jgi:hypothetical protein
LDVTEMSGFLEIQLKARFGVRLAGLIGLTLLVTGCDKCGDWVHFDAPSLPKNCTATQPPQK